MLAHLGSVALGRGGARQQALLEITRSLADIDGPRAAIVRAGGLSRLLRMIGPSVPLTLVEPAAAAIVVLARAERSSCEALLNAQARTEPREIAEKSPRKLPNGH